MSPSRSAAMGPPTAASGAGYIFPTLTISAPTSGADAQKVVLSGTATAQADGTIGNVDTRVSFCAPTVATATGCAETGYIPFTDTTLASPVPVVTGQQIVVTVKISFS